MRTAASAGWGLLACAIGLTACSTPSIDDIGGFWEDEPERMAPLQPVANRIALTELWSYSVGSSYEDPDSHIAPWIDRDQVLLAGNGGEVAALHAETGAKIWEVEVEGTVLAGVAANETHVYVGTWEREVYALNRKDGTLVWQQTLPSEVLNLKALPEGRLAARTNDGRLSVLQTEDGALLWSHVHSSPSLTLRGAGVPEADEDRVLTGFDDGRLMSFDAKSGLQHWDVRMAMPTGRTELERVVDIDGPLQLKEGVAYAAALGNRVGAVETVEGSMLWSQEAEARHAPAIDDVSVYVIDIHSAVWSLNQKSGKVQWRQAQLDHRDLSAPASTGLYVIAVDREGYLHWLQITDGEVVARHKVEGALQAPPQIRLDRVYLLHRSGRFAVYQYVPLLSAAADES